MNASYEAIIFDLDGVLCSTDRFHYLAWKKMADREGIYFDETINQRLRGVSRMESLEIVLERASRTYTDEEKEAMATDKNAYYRELLQTMGPGDMPADVRPTLDELRAKGYLLAVGSSSKNTPLILQKIGMESYFDAVADGNDITRSKPDPEVFLLAAERLQKPPRACLVVEDAAAGIEAAERGGFDAAGIGAAMDDPRARFHLRSFSHLLQCLIPTHTPI